MTRKTKTDMKDYFYEFIENMNNGYDVSDYHFIFKLSDGRIYNITENDEIPSIDFRKLVYAVREDSCDGIDSCGKTWSKDFFKDDELWNKNIENNLYGTV